MEQTDKKGVILKCLHYNLNEDINKFMSLLQYLGDSFEDEDLNKNIIFVEPS